MKYENKKHEPNDSVTETSFTRFDDLGVPGTSDRSGARLGLYRDSENSVLSSGASNFMFATDGAAAYSRQLGTEETILKVPFTDDRPTTRNRKSKCDGSPWGLIMAGVAVVIVGLIAYFAFRSQNGLDDRPHGDILPDVTEPDACPDVMLSLEENIFIQCTFNASHKDTRAILDMVGIQLRTPSTIYYNFDTKYVKTKDSVTINITGPKMSCGLEGVFTLSFLKMEGMVITQRDVSVGLIASNVTFDVDREDNGTLRLICKLEKKCQNFQLAFWGRSDKKNFTLNEERRCDIQHEPSRGYNSTCTATYLESQLLDQNITVIGCGQTEQDGPIHRLDNNS